MRSNFFCFTRLYWFFHSLCPTNGSKVDGQELPHECKLLGAVFARCAPPWWVLVQWLLVHHLQVLLFHPGSPYPLGHLFPLLVNIFKLLNFVLEMRQVHISSDASIGYFCHIQRKFATCFELKVVYFHRIGPLGWFGLVVAMSVCLCICPLPMRLF